MTLIKYASAFLLMLGVQLAAPATFATTPADQATPLLWDPGITHEGTRAVTHFSESSSNYLFRVTTANPSLGAWRTALSALGSVEVYFLPLIFSSLSKMGRKMSVS